MAEPAVVPPGERADLQKTAQQTGERFGNMDAVIAEHSKHLDKINGSITTLAGEMKDLGTGQAVMTGSMKAIERTLEMKVLNYDTRLTVVEAWIAENRGGRATSARWANVSLQVWLGLFAAFIALVGVAITVILTFVVLYANHSL